MKIKISNLLFYSGKRHLFFLKKVIFTFKNNHKDDINYTILKKLQNSLYFSLQYIFLLKPRKNVYIMNHNRRSHSKRKLLTVLNFLRNFVFWLVFTCSREAMCQPNTKKVGEKTQGASPSTNCF